MRRETLEIKNDYENKINLADESEKASLRSSLKNKFAETELTVWLKDFPKTASDFKEMRRSAAQHMPEIDVSIHAGILIEENFKIDYDDEEPPSNNGRELSEENKAEEEAEL